MGTYTPKKNLYKPGVNEVGWGTLVDVNWDTLDNTADQSYVDSGDAATLASAKSYADAGDATTLAAAKAYTDTSVATGVNWNELQNATAALTLANGTNNTTFNQTSAATWTWANTTLATSSVSQSSPILNLNGQYWTGSVSATDSWTIQNVLANGTNGTSTLTFAHSGTSGNAQVQVPAGGAGIPGLAVGNTSQGLSSINAATLAFNCSNITTGFTISFYASTAVIYQYSCNVSSGNCGLAMQTANLPYWIQGNITTGARAAFMVGNNNTYAATSGTQYGMCIGDPTGVTNTSLSFAPASGTANFVGLLIQPTINQTGTSSGNYTGLLVNLKETALKGTDNRLLDLQAGAAGGTSKFTVTNSGALKTYNAEATAGVGVGYVRGSTLQKSETGADANVLTVTPAAAAGLYRITVVFSVSAATAATLGWTATWTDSNAHAQAPTNLALSQAGVAAPALTFTAAANGVYSATQDIDVDASGTAIVIKATFAGTSIAYKASATIERIA